MCIFITGYGQNETLSCLIDYSPDPEPLPTHSVVFHAASSAQFDKQKFSSRVLQLHRIAALVYFPAFCDKDCLDAVQAPD